MILTKNSNSKVAIIITAAGSSTRIGGSIKKEYLPYKNGTVLTSCAKTFLKACIENQQKYRIVDFVITCPLGGINKCNTILEQDSELQDLILQIADFKKEFNISIIEGSTTRQKSVFNGLGAIKNSPDIVLIHDGARPFVTNKIIIDSIETAYKFGACVPGLPPVDTQKEIDENGFIKRHLQRNLLCSVQTPQSFEYNKLLAAHQKAAQEEKEYTDDTEIWGEYCGAVKVIPGDVNNIKITYPKDLERLEK